MTTHVDAPTDIGPDHPDWPYSMNNPEHLRRWVLANIGLKLGDDLEKEFAVHAESRRRENCQSITDVFYTGKLRFQVDADSGHVLLDLDTVSADNAAQVLSIISAAIDHHK